jgi:hypothetical protein
MDCINHSASHRTNRSEPEPSSEMYSSVKAAPPRPACAASWAISLLRCSILILRTPLILSRCCKTSAYIAWHLQHDLDNVAHLSPIFLHVTIIIRRLQSSYPASPVSILEHPIQDRKERFLIRSVFHPKNTYARHIHTNFLDQDINKILPRSL